MLDLNFILRRAGGLPGVWGSEPFLFTAPARAFLLFRPIKDYKRSKRIRTNVTTMLLGRLRQKSSQLRLCTESYYTSCNLARKKGWLFFRTMESTFASKGHEQFRPLQSRTTVARKQVDRSWSTRVISAGVQAISSTIGKKAQFLSPNRSLVTTN
jgi:hypothetical protein